MLRRHVLSLLAGVGAAGAGSLLAGCGTGNGASGQKHPTEIKLGDNATNDPEISAERHFGQRLAALTNNRFTVNVVPNSALGDTNHMNEAVRQGALQVTKCLVGTLSIYDKRLSALSLPYVFPRQDELFGLLDGALGAKIATITEGFDMVLLGFFDAGIRNIYNSKRPIRVPADLKGLCLRAPDDRVAVDTFNQLNAQVTPLNSDKVLSAFQQGIIDGAENNIILYMTNKHVDYAHYYSWTRHQFGIDVLLASKTWLSGLQKRDQDAVRQAGQEAAGLERQLWQSQNATYVTEAQTAGVHLNDDVDVAAFQQAVKPVIDRHKAEISDLAKLLPLP